MNKRETSARLFEAATKVMPGGVNSPVRAFRGVGGTPPFIKRASGPWVYDEDDNRYLDFVGSWGPMIVGHAHPEVVEAAQRAIRDGFSFGAPTRAETVLAEEIVARVPHIEMVRLVNSGTEATMSAVRLARAATGRDRIVKFDGCYHGHADSFLVAAGSGALDIGEPSSPGVPGAVVKDSLIAPFNDLAVVEDFLAGDDVAAVIVEPVGGNAGCIPPIDGFLEGLRELCDRHGTLLILDEVMTGFRVARGGAIERYGIRPDLVTFGKVIGGGFPIGAYAGPEHLMRQVAPSGSVYQAGTLSGNPVAVAAGTATLALLDAAAYETLESLGAYLERSLIGVIHETSFPVVLQRVGSMFSLFLRSEPVLRVSDAADIDHEQFASFFHGMLDDGFYLAPSAYESSFLSLSHTPGLIDEFVAGTAEHLHRVFTTLV